MIAADMALIEMSVHILLLKGEEVDQISHSFFSVKRLDVLQDRSFSQDHPCSVGRFLVED